MKLVDLTGEEPGAWDAFVRTCVNGTMFHERAFLAYHGTRFAGAERFLVFESAGKPFAGIALAVTERDGERVALAPYGASYGGMLYARTPDYRRARGAAGALIEHLRGEGIDRCSLTPTVDYAPVRATGTGTFALIEAGFRSVNRDITSVVFLDPDEAVDGKVSQRVAPRRARDSGVQIDAQATLDAFWPALEATFRKHGARPTHEREELSDLVARMGPRIRLWVARVDGETVAGVALFRVRDEVEMTFYLCRDPSARDTQALSLLLLEVLAQARRDGRRCVDLGTSSVGMQARPGVFEFKENYTRAGLFRETVEWRAGADGHG